MLVDAEHLARDNRRLGRLLKDAELRSRTHASRTSTRPARGLDRSMVRQLGTCTWVAENLNVLITGATGVGKSYVASSLGQAACRRRLRVMCLGSSTRSRSLAPTPSSRLLIVVRNPCWASERTPRYVIVCDRLLRHPTDRADVLWRLCGKLIRVLGRVPKGGAHILNTNGTSRSALGIPLFSRSNCRRDWG